MVKGDGSLELLFGFDLMVLESVTSGDFEHYVLQHGVSFCFCLYYQSTKDDAGKGLQKPDVF